LPYRKYPEISSLVSASLMPPPPSLAQHTAVLPTVFVDGGMIPHRGIESPTASSAGTSRE